MVLSGKCRKHVSDMTINSRALKISCLYFLFVTAVRSEYKDFGILVGPDTYIHTILFEPATSPLEPATPLVMIHGFGCGIPQYYKNYDQLRSTRQVYSLDLPGYGRSSRVQFTDDPESNENLFVEYLEKWRVGVGLEKFILLGHSFGAFLSAAYTIKYTSHVRHLVLNDPWGLPVYLEEMQSGRGRRFPVWITAVAMVVAKFNPFTPIRAAGPVGKTGILYMLQVVLLICYIQVLISSRGSDLTSPTSLGMIS